MKMRKPRVNNIYNNKNDLVCYGVLLVQVDWIP